MTIGSKKEKKVVHALVDLLYILSKNKVLSIIKYLCSIYIVKDESNYRVKKFK